MAKKNFTRGLSSLLGNQPDLFEQAEGSESNDPKKPNSQENSKSTHAEIKQKEIRATFIINEVHLEKLKAIAYWERSLIKDVINASLEQTIAKYEGVNGEIKLIPKK